MIPEKVIYLRDYFHTEDMLTINVLSPKSTAVVKDTKNQLDRESQLFTGKNNSEVSRAKSFKKNSLKSDLVNDDVRVVLFKLLCTG